MALPRPTQLAPSTALVLDKMRQGSSTNTLSVSNTSPLSEGEALIEINDSSAEQGQRLSEDQCNTFMLRTSMGLTAIWLAMTAVMIVESIRNEENLFETAQYGLPYFLFSVLTWIFNMAAMANCCSTNSEYHPIGRNSMWEIPTGSAERISLVTEDSAQNANARALYRHLP